MSDGEFNNWDQITDAFDMAINQVVRKTAFDVQGHAQANALVDTGFLKNSIYVSTSEENTYGQGVGSPPKGASLLPEEKPEDKNTAIIGVGASYGIYVEMGTRFMPAKPYLVPAVDAVRPEFEAAMGKIEDKLKEIRG